MQTASIGYVRLDGDFALLATLNNNDELLSEAEFHALAAFLASLYQRAAPEQQIQVLDREDAPDYLEFPYE